MSKLRCCMMVAVALLTLCRTPAEEVLGPSTSVTLPTAPASTQGFSCDVRIADQHSLNYIAVRISVKAVGTFTADRRLNFRFATERGGQTPPRNGLTIDVPIVLRQGNTSETYVRYLPKWSAGLALEVSVWEDGRVLPDYADVIGSMLPRGSLRPDALLAQEASLNLLLIDDSSVSAMPGNQSSLDHVAITELPTDWRGYQNHDAVIITDSVIESLSTKNKGAMSALRDWILVGGTVIVAESESPESSLAKLHLTWNSNVDSDQAARKTAQEVSAQWKDNLVFVQKLLATIKERTTALTTTSKTTRPQPVAPELPSAMGIHSLEEAIQMKALYEQSLSELQRATDSRRNLWHQEVGAGQVICVAHEAELVSSSPYQEILSVWISFRTSPILRRGVDPMIGDNRFSRWLIPGVAQPPVYTFMGLLTLFVVLVGPIAYRKTAKVGRSYLMFGIAPALALLTTLAMFGYGVLSDGFGTVVRVRQVTFVDGASGDAGERVRSTYFAGVRPGSGLGFAADAEVMNYLEGSGKSWEEQHGYAPDIIGRIVVSEDEQRFDSSFLPSRQQRQFVVHQPRRNFGHLTFTPPGADRVSGTLESTFPVAMETVVIRDDRGQHWLAENVAPDATSSCSPMTVKDASKLLGKMYNDHSPVSTQVVSRRSQKRSYTNQVFDVVSHVNQRVAPDAIAIDGLFEMTLLHQMKTVGEVPRNCFLAIAQPSADVIAVGSSESSASVRYIYGTLR